MMMRTSRLLGRAPLQRKLHPKKRVLVKGDEAEAHLPETPSPRHRKNCRLAGPNLSPSSKARGIPINLKKYDEGQAVLRWRLEGYCIEVC